MNVVVKVFLLISLLAIWAPGFAVVAMRKKGEKASMATPAGTKTATTGRIYAAWWIVYLLWALLVVLFLFNQETINWFGRIALLDTDTVKIVAIAITCLGYYLLVAVSILTFLKSINTTGKGKGRKTALITSGIYSYSRNPMYLAIIIGVSATFLMIPSIFSLLVAVSMTVVLYMTSSDEEKRLEELYGEEYRKYRNDVGMILPKGKNTFQKK